MMQEGRKGAMTAAVGGPPPNSNSKVWPEYIPL